MRTVRSWLSVCTNGAALALPALACVLGAGATVAGAMPADTGSVAALAASCGTDEFDGAALDDARWDVLRPAGTGPSVSGGKLNLELRNTDLIGGTATAENLVLQDAPDGGWTATTTLDTAAIDENGEQAGLVLWKSEGPPALNNAFGKVVAIRNNAGAYKYEAIWTDGGGLAIPIADSGADVPALPAQATIRLRSDGETVTAEYRDGDTWKQIGRPAKYDAPLRVGAVALRGSGGSGTVAYENFALTCGPEVTLSASKLTGTAPLAVDFTSTVSDAAADVDWRFGDGGTADGGATQSHTFTEPGTYRVRVRAENAAGDTTVESVRVVVGDGQPPQLGDEFVGNELDPKWEILRPRATLRSVSDGALRLGNAGGDMHGTNASAPNVLLQTLPETPAVASTQIDVSNLVNGGDQVGMVVWRSESPNHFAKVVYNRRSATEYWFERSRTDNGGTTGGNTGTVVGSPQKIQIRIASSGGANPTFTPERSVDGGQTWAAVQPAFSLAGTGPVKVGLTFFSGNTLRTAAFDWFRVGTPECIANGTPEAGFSRLWNGVSLDGTAQAGLGGFNVVSDGAEGCRLVSTGGMGMLWFNTKQYDNFVLRAQFKTADATDNSGIFVRFPNPGNDPYVAINNGHEIQVREGVQGDGEDQKTGSVYNFDREDKRAGKAPGQWNDYEIRYEAGKYTITLNGEVVNEWQNNLQQGKTGGYIGLQNHGPSDEVSFRNLRIQELTSTTTNLFTTIGITRSETRQNSGIFGTPTRYSLPAEEMPPSRTVGPAPNDTVDNVPLRMPDTSGTQPNLAAFNGQTLTLRDQDRKQYSKIHFFGMTTDGGPAGGDFLLRYADDSTQTINVQFRDWCGPQNTPAHHQAIGPLTKRHREVGEDGARCGIYHVPADAQAGKTLVSVTLPSSTSPGEPPIQSYLMALTLEEPGGFFETPDLSGTVAFPDDEKAPVTTHALNPGAPNGNDGWYAGPVRVTLTAEDEDGGSGVERMMYRVDGGAPQPYTGAFDFAVEGEHTLEYASIDGAGNAEGYKSVTLKVDPSAPATGARTTPRDPLGIDGWHDGAVTLTLTPRDGQGSGAEQTEYRIDGGGWQEYDGPVVIDAAGIHDVEYFSTDVAGNEEEPASLRVKIDRTAPVTTARINGAAPLAEYTGPVRIAFTRTDGDGSGAIATEYRIGDGAWTDYTGAFDVDGLRGHRVDFRSRDHAGNVENFKTVMFVIRPAPVALGTPPPPATAPKPAPFAALQPLSRKRSTVAALRRGELAVRVSCQGVDAGTVRLTVSRALARKLGLKSRLLAKGTVRCGAEGRANVTLEPRAKVKRALAHRKGAVAATLALRMGETNDSAAVVLRGSR